ncbi:gastrula zinc finger protein XlCGF57.1-like isoform X15 [Rhipicephalus sanguineus]|uniref:gastrula zinc finger protein XlCGF57.1-like isoform X15 n=1 Tax=Rhipicephalus sanguineus TaxID=34632 RepID=UPI0020C56D6E|nr:gastrula zinc finger protein XlCGF57.1-like isoform X15 [Rhipicephalus sanguineus]
MFVQERNVSQAAQAAFSRRQTYEPLFGSGTIGQTPGPSHCCKTDLDDVAADPVYDAAWGLTLESGKAVETSPEPACELGHVTDKSVQVRLLTHHEASQANEKKILSTSATQTEPQAVSSGSLFVESLEQSSSLASVQDQRHSCQQGSCVTLKKSTMNGHLQKHMDKPLLQCHLCSAAFVHNSKLLAHVRTHTGERPFSCVHCNASFSMKCYLARHIRTHTGQHPFCCVHCNASFTRKDKLNEHMRTHTGERPFSCVHCNACFMRKDKLSQHMRAHTGERPYSCVDCDASFSRKNLLNDHMRSHTGERPFSCDHCNASFMRKTTLNDHMRSHTGERPFSCVLCNSSFSRKDSLNDHMRTHTGERPFSCDHCHASFSRKDQLSDHMRTHTVFTSMNAATSSRRLGIQQVLKLWPDFGRMAESCDRKTDRRTKIFLFQYPKKDYRL